MIGLIVLMAVNVCIGYALGSVFRRNWSALLVYWAWCGASGAIYAQLVKH